MNKTTIFVNASAVKESSCMLRTFRKIVLGYKEPVNNNDVEFGQAFHTFRKEFKQHGDIGKAITPALKYFKETPMRVKSKKKYMTEVYLQRACFDYAAEYEHDTVNPIRDEQGNALLEIEFAFPYYSDESVEIIIAGTIDDISKKQNGINLLVDCKTTSVWDIKGYFDGYKLSPQMRFYFWALQRYAREYPDSIIAKVVNDGIGIMIDGVFLGGTDKITYSRSDVMIPTDQDMGEFETLLGRFVAKLIDQTKLWKTLGHMPHREGVFNGACQTVYGPCLFANVCGAPDQVAAQHILNYNFKQEPYIPVGKRDV